MVDNLPMVENFEVVERFLFDQAYENSLIYSDSETFSLNRPKILWKFPDFKTFLKCINNFLASLFLQSDSHFSICWRAACEWDQTCLV